MSQQFVVPQFIDTEAKILGPITGRQFLILLTAVLVDFVIYRLFITSIPIVIIGIVLVTTIAIIFAFIKVNGRPFHYIMLNMIQTLKRPRLRVWDKRVTDADIRAGLKTEPEKIITTVPIKSPLATSRLSELSLVVNTGGSYQPESDVTDLISDLNP